MTRLINRVYNKKKRLVLGLSCFLVLFLIYNLASYLRLQENPDDKLLPSLAKMSVSISKLALEPQRRTGVYVLWNDSLASLLRIGQGLGLAALVGLIIGINTGSVPILKHTFSPFFTFVCMIPPLAVLPILFILFGVDELAKVVLIFIGTVFVIIRDLIFKSENISAEQIAKAQCLGANTWQILIRVILPQVFPRLIEVTRLSIGSAWLFLIAAEAISATEGLGYRIFLVRRYLSMDIIIPYVLWITFLGYSMDFLLSTLNKKCFPWYTGGR